MIKLEIRHDSANICMVVQSFFNNHADIFNKFYFCLRFYDLLYLNIFYRNVPWSGIIKMRLQSHKIQAVYARRCQETLGGEPY